MTTRSQTRTLEADASTSVQSSPVKRMKLDGSDDVASRSQLTTLEQRLLVLEEGDPEDPTNRPSDWCWNWLPVEVKNRIHYWKTVAEQRDQMKAVCEEINELPICPWAGFTVLTEKQLGQRYEIKKCCENGTFAC